MFETLEKRQLLTSVSVYGSYLKVEGGSGDDLITVKETNHAVHVEYYDRQGVLQTRDVNGIYAISIFGGKGDDAIFYTGTTVGADIHGDKGSTYNNYCGGSSGGSGYNRYCGGSSGGSGWGWNWKCKKDSNHNKNQDGADFITVADEGTGASRADGDGGSDTITVLVGNTTGKRTSILGGSGNDAIYLNTGVGVYNVANSRVEVEAEAGNDTITTYEGRNYIYGGSGSDTVLDFGGNNSVYSATIISI